MKPTTFRTKASRQLLFVVMPLFLAMSGCSHPVNPEDEAAGAITLRLETGAPGLAATQNPEFAPQDIDSVAVLVF
ncbi:MAG: hypothetical protein KAJ37_00915, partial [Candidatus Krumholzibacteria bacterium]|nr:hypothetical protein [Candidatus Krumholzibacteria bacterium]